MGGQEDLQRSLGAIMAAKRDALGEPPTAEELLAYRDGRLAAAARQRLEARLALFPDAARALADLAAFPDVEPAPGTAELSDDEVAARWLAFRDQLPAYPEPRKDGRPVPIQVRGSWWAPNLRLAAAALAGLAVGTAAGFLGGRTGHEAPGSAVNVEIAELTPVEEGGTRAAPKPVEIPPGAEELLLVLITPSGKGYSEYEAQVEDASGARVWARDGLHPTDLGTFHVAFRRGALPAGDLRVRLFGREKGVRERVGTYEVRLLP